MLESYTATQLLKSPMLLFRSFCLDLSLSLISVAGLVNAPGKLPRRTELYISAIGSGYRQDQERH